MARYVCFQDLIGHLLLLRWKACSQGFRERPPRGGGVKPAATKKAAGWYSAKMKDNPTEIQLVQDWFKIGSKKYFSAAMCKFYVCKREIRTTEMET